MRTLRRDSQPVSALMGRPLLGTYELPEWTQGGALNVLTSAPRCSAPTDLNPLGQAHVACFAN
eukprot:11408814-Alexandrium_andersonii.AAC.1